MATFPSAGPFVALDPLVIPQTGIASPSQSVWLQKLSDQISAVATVVNTGLGTNFLALGSQPTLGVSDAGYVLWVSDYAHLVYWDGAAWQWMDGDRPGRLDHFSADPGVGWGLCDGSTYPMLVVGGATLTTSNVVTPNLTGTAVYFKSGASYTGTPAAASGSTADTPNVVGFTHIGTDGYGFATTQHNHTVGTIDMPHLVTLVYVRC